MKWRHLIIVVMSLLIVGCSSKPLVSWNYNHQVDWDEMTTWAWSAKNQSTSLMAQTVFQLVSQNLAEKGLEEVPPKQAQLLLSWGFSENSKLESTVYGDQFYFAPYPFFMNAGPPEVVVNSYEVGRLALTVTNPATGLVIWQGVASKQVTANMTPKEQQAYIKASVDSLLAKFPPQVMLLPDNS